MYIWYLLWINDQAHISFLVLDSYSCDLLSFFFMKVYHILSTCFHTLTPPPQTTVLKDFEFVGVGLLSLYNDETIWTKPAILQKHTDKSKSRNRTQWNSYYEQMAWNINCYHICSVDDLWSDLDYTTPLNDVSKCASIS